MVSSTDNLRIPKGLNNVLSMAKHFSMLAVDARRRPCAHFLRSLRALFSTTRFTWSDDRILGLLGLSTDTSSPCQTLTSANETHQLSEFAHPDS